MSTHTEGYHGDKKTIHVTGYGRKRNGQHTKVLSIVKDCGSDTACYLTRAEITNLIEELQAALADMKPVLPKADAYRGYSTITGKDIYFAEIPHDPGFYAGGGSNAESAINMAKLFDRGILDAKYWIKNYGPSITPVYLTERTITDVTEGDTVTF